METVNPKIIIQQKRRLEKTEILMYRRILSKERVKYVRREELLRNMGNKETLQKLCQKEKAGISVIYNNDKGVRDLRFTEHVVDLLRNGKHCLTYLTSINESRTR